MVHTKKEPLAAAQLPFRHQTVNWSLTVHGLNTETSHEHRSVTNWAGWSLHVNPSSAKLALKQNARGHGPIRSLPYLHDSNKPPILLLKVAFKFVCALQLGAKPKQLSNQPATQPWSRAPPRIQLNPIKNNPSTSPEWLSKYRFLNGNSLTSCCIFYTAAISMSHLKL